MKEVKKDLTKEILSPYEAAIVAENIKRVETIRKPYSSDAQEKFVNAMTMISVITVLFFYFFIIRG